MIEDGDFVILKREAFMRVVHARKNGRPLMFDRTKFYLDSIFGKPYGSQFEVDKKTNQLVEKAQDFSLEELLLPDASSGLDNRNLVSSNEDNQSLGKEEIQALRKDGLTGDEVMTELIKNSTTFNQKTKFSQEKWIKKKKRRHLNVYTILKPCTRLIAHMYYARDPSKICFLRMDTLAQVLLMSNVQANSKVLLIESCQGLLAGAILDRLSDKGCLTQLFTSPNPMKGRNAFDDFGFKKELTKSRMKLYPLHLLHELAVFAKSKPNISIEDESEVEPVAKKSRLMDTDRSADRSADWSAGAETSNVDIPSGAETGDVDITAGAETGDVDTPAVSETGEMDSPAAAKTGEIDTPAETETDYVAIPAVVEGSAEDTVSSPGNKVTHRSTPTSSTSVEINNSKVPEKKELNISNTENSREKSVKETPPHIVERQAAKLYLETTKFDTLVVAVKAQPTQLVLRLIGLVKSSRPFVIFHQYKEPLVELFVQLKERGGFVNLKLSETWFRSMQVLPQRTHPTVNMSGTSGYLLTGTTVERS